MGGQNKPFYAPLPLTFKRWCGNWTDTRRSSDQPTSTLVKHAEEEGGGEMHPNFLPGPFNNVCDTTKAGGETYHGAEPISGPVSRKRENFVSEFLNDHEQ